MLDKELMKQIRTTLNLTQREFAKSLGTYQQVIAMIETGKRDVPKSIINSLLEVYDIDYYQNSKSRKEHQYIINLTFCTNNSKKDILKKFIDVFDDIEAIEIHEVKNDKVA